MKIIPKYIKCTDCNWERENHQLLESDDPKGDVLCPKCGSARLIPIKNK